MKKMKKHPIQLMQMQVHEILFKRNKNFSTNDEGEEPNLKIGTGHEIFDDGAVLAVGIKAKTENSATAKYNIAVELVGLFSVSDGFDKQFLSEWAEENAPFLLLPYVREHIYSLSLRAGLNPLFLPTVEVPPLSKETKEAFVNAIKA